MTPDDVSYDAREPTLVNPSQPDYVTPGVTRATKFEQILPKLPFINNSSKTTDQNVHYSNPSEANVPDAFNVASKDFFF